MRTDLSTVGWPLAAVAACALFACSPAAGPEADAHPHQDHAEEVANERGEETASLDLEGVRGVRFEPAGEPREEGAWFAAEAVVDPGGAAVVATPVGGRLVALRSAPGARVAAGAPVADIESPELADLAAALLAADSRRQRAERELARERRLLEAAATSAREVEAAETELAIAAAEGDAARLALAGRGLDPARAGARLVLAAPRAGILAGFDALLGEVVPAGARIATVVAPGAARVRVELPLPGPQSWEPGAATDVRRSDGRGWRARVEGTPPALADSTRRLTYFLRLEGEELPLAGTPLEVRVPLARAVVLPQVALQQIEGRWGVFVRGGERADFRAVRKGPELGGDVLVLEGVAPGDEVATDGAYLLKALWLKRAGGGGGHDH